jgi:hypothetical protein
MAALIALTSQLVSPLAGADAGLSCRKSAPPAVIGPL